MARGMAAEAGTGDGRHQGVGPAAPTAQVGPRIVGRGAPLVLLCLLWLLPVPAAALAILPGQSLEVDFSMTGAAATADVLTFELGAGTSESGVTGVAVSLYDGATLLGTRSGAVGDLTAFVASGSAWTVNAVAADLTSIQTGTITGRIVVTPTFDGSPGAELDANFFPATDILIGRATGPSSLIPLAAGSITVSTPFALPEPGSLALLAAATLLGAARPRPSRGD